MQNLRGKLPEVKLGKLKGAGMDISKTAEKLGSSLKLNANLAGLKIKKYSPEILMGVGIVGMIGSAVLACKASYSKANDIFVEHKEKMDTIAKGVEMNADDTREFTYTDQERIRDIVIVHLTTGAKLVELYSPAIGLGLASIGCILGAHNIMSKRIVAASAAYNIVAQSFKEYRERVIEELGDQSDLHFLTGSTIVEETETVVDEETGKKSKVKVQRHEIPQLNNANFARIFEPKNYDSATGGWSGSPNFSAKKEYNFLFLTQSQKFLNDKLNARGYLFLNEVYRQLGFSETAYGQIVGWLKRDGNGVYTDNDDICLFKAMQPLETMKDGDPILIDFAPDGIIWNLI